LLGLEALVEALLGPVGDALRGLHLVQVWLFLLVPLTARLDDRQLLLVRLAAQILEHRGIALVYLLIFLVTG
jgi:hypothetical protein